MPTFHSMSISIASITGQPGISLPVGLTSAGLPVGMEIDGPEQSDRRLLAVAKTLENIINFRARPTKPEPEASP
jgi:mandelamide amidase